MHQNAMNEPKYYQFRVGGHLDDALLDWFDGISFINLENGEALLYGYIRDQAALHGVIDKIESLGLPLLTVNIVVPPEDPMIHVKGNHE